MKSIREIYKIGKGPSSSHTMGPEQAAILFKSRYPQADAFQVILYGSLSKTGVGHGTDRVIQEVFAPLPTEIIFSKEDHFRLQQVLSRNGGNRVSLLAYAFTKPTQEADCQFSLLRLAPTAGSLQQNLKGQIFRQRLYLYNEVI